VNWVEDKQRVQAYRYFFGEGLGEAYTLVGYMCLLLEKHGAALARCLHYVVLENRSEGAPRLGPGTFAQLLSGLCRKHGAKCLFHVGGCGKPLPAVSAAAKVYSLLKRGETVTIKSIDGKIAVTASSPEELLDKLLQLLYG
jgi:hypothetical protein